MKKLERSRILAVFAASLALILTGPIAALAATTPSLGAAATYGVLGSTYTNTTVTTINGDVGFTTPPATAPLGAHTNYGSGAPYATAGIDQAAALATLNSAPCDFTFGSATDLSLLTQPLTPGVYCVTGAQSIGTGGITLVSGTYIFRSTGALNTVANSSVVGGSACDVFWTPTATTLGANSTFVGTDIDPSGITVGAVTNWGGRALAFGGTVTTDTDSITVPTCTPPPSTGFVVVTKDVVGGTATSSDFTLTASTTGGIATPSPFSGSATGTSVAITGGASYNIIETGGPSGYTASSTGACSGMIVASTTVFCTITNTFASTSTSTTGTLVVQKVVINDNGGTATTTDFSFHVDGGATTTFAVSGQNSFPVLAGVHAVAESSAAGYTSAFSGDCDVNGNVVVTASATSTCTITNNDRPATLTLVKRSVGGNGTFDFNITGSTTATTSIQTSDGVGTSSPISLNAGTSTITEVVPATGWNFSTSTCVNGIQSIGSPFPGGGTIHVDANDNVTCTITNTIVIAPPAPAAPPSSGGGGNGPIFGSLPAAINAPVEVLGASTGNVPQGEVLGASTASVSVPPGFPNTGFPPEENGSPWSTAVPVGILVLVSISLAVALRKRAI